MTAARSAAGPRHSAALSKNNGSFIRTPPRRGRTRRARKCCGVTPDGQDWTSIIVPSRTASRARMALGDSCQTARYNVKRGGEDGADERDGMTDVVPPGSMDSFS
ncbi:hypothetical protein HPB50_000641 [Hyalomma asiaticum]|uniref:Uncharacterized protein n=1 Tax=Hyalomma asiaticum TaxID=266040 RepID=A0ACB7TEW0_HYAAI|nr:hypothetical protein HPB50_000641 [Hyalomma asiaticum]